MRGAMAFRKPKSPLSAWIVQQRKERDWKSEELARRLGVSDSTVRSWESGRPVSADNLDGLERLFGVTSPGAVAATSAAPDLTPLIEAMARALDAQASVFVRLEERFSRLEEGVRVAVEEAAGERQATLDALADLRRELTALRSVAGSGGGPSVQRLP